jgi:glycosyltransferase involved in cell wall biosynthesis
MAKSIGDNPFSVSVVIPAFNVEKSIGRALRSVLDQTLKPQEIIVVDDGSTDGTAAETKKFGRKVKYLRQDNAGPSQARNTGIEAARGTWIAFLDADDEWLLTKLEEQMALLKRHPDLFWCGANAFNNNEGVETYRSSPVKAREGLAGKEYFDHYFVAVGGGYIIEATNTFVIKRAVFEEVGLFNTEYIRVEDSEMWCRIAFEHPKFGYIPHPLSRFHLDVRNPTLEKRRHQHKDGKLFRKLVSSHLPLAEEKGCEREYRQYATWIIRNSLVQTIYHGFKPDARETVDRFGFLFPRYVTWGTYALTVFPNLTSRTAKTAAYLYHLAKMEKRITRRWTDADVLGADNP